jgi:hypothetical protein
MVVVPSSVEKGQETAVVHHHEKNDEFVREEPLGEMLAKAITITAHHIAENPDSLKQEMIDVVLSNEKVNTSFVATQEEKKEEEVGTVYCRAGGSVAPPEDGGPLSPRSSRKELLDNTLPIHNAFLSLPDFEEFSDNDHDDVPCTITCSFDQIDDGDDDDDDDDVTCSTVYCTGKQENGEEEEDDDDPEVSVQDMLLRQSSAGFISMIEDLDEDID